MAFNLLITDDCGLVIHRLTDCTAIVAGVVDEDDRHEIGLIDCTMEDLARAVVAAEDSIKEAETGVPGIKKAKRYIRKYESDNKEPEEGGDYET